MKQRLLILSAIICLVTQVDAKSANQNQNQIKNQNTKTILMLGESENRKLAAAEISESESSEAPAAPKYAPIVFQVYMGVDMVFSERSKFTSTTYHWASGSKFLDNIEYEFKNLPRLTLGARYNPKNDWGCYGSFEYIFPVKSSTEYLKFSDLSYSKSSKGSITFSKVSLSVGVLYSVNPIYFNLGAGYDFPSYTGLNGPIFGNHLRVGIGINLTDHFGLELGTQTTTANNIKSDHIDAQDDRKFIGVSNSSYLNTIVGF